PLSPTNLALANRGLRVFDTWSAANNTPYSWIENQTPPPGFAYLAQPMWKRGMDPNDQPANPDWTAARLPLRIKVRALQLRIRMWDFKTEQTRQITIMQNI